MALLVLSVVGSDRPGLTKALAAAVLSGNRNFEGRQGKGGRTFLASPLTAVAAAVNGVVTDPREMYQPEMA